MGVEILKALGVNKQIDAFVYEKYPYLKLYKP